MTVGPADSACSGCDEFISGEFDVDELVAGELDTGKLNDGGFDVDKSDPNELRLTADSDSLGCGGLTTTSGESTSGELDSGELDSGVAEDGGIGSSRELCGVGKSVMGGL